MRIGVAGIAGRMGRLVAEEVVLSGATLAGGTCRPGTEPPADFMIFPDIAALAAGSDAVVDFTHESTVAGHARALSAACVAWVLGTTGLSDAAQADVNAAAGRIAVVQAANFAPGVNLLLAVAERLGAALPAEVYDAEILEMHHRQKRDAPSGTALALGHAVAAGRGVVFADTALGLAHGETGPRRTGGIGFAAMRGGQVVGEHTLVFAAADEHISISHRAFDRRSFARGAVRAALWAHGRPAGHYSMQDVLDLRRVGAAI